MVRSNVILINLLASDIIYNIQDELSKIQKENILFPLGTLIGSKIFSGMGPNISLQIVPTGNIDAKFRSDFVSAGVNQTIHRLYLVLSCEVNVLTSYNIIKTNVLNEVLFAENIIVGDVPATYYNLQGIEARDSLEVLN